MLLVIIPISLESKIKILSVVIALIIKNLKTD